MSETFWQLLGAVVCIGSMLALWLYACRLERRPWRQVLSNAVTAACVVSLVVLAVSAVVDNIAWMLASAGVFLVSCLALVKLLGPSMGATD